MFFLSIAYNYEKKKRHPDYPNGPIGLVFNELFEGNFAAMVIQSPIGFREIEIFSYQATSD